MTLEDLLKNSQVAQFVATQHLSADRGLLETNSGVLSDFVDQLAHPLFPDYRPELVLLDGRIDIFYQKTTASPQGNSLRIGQAASLFKVSFSDFEIDEQRNQALISAINFAETYSKTKKFHKGIYLWGNFGVGKSYLMSALLNELAMKNIKTAFVNFSALITRLNDLQMLEKQRLIRRISQAEVLVIDDIGAGDLTTWVRDNVLAAILDSRMNDLRPTFFTSNFDMKSLEEQYLAVARGVSEPIKAARIIERIKFLSDPIEMGGKSRR
ncbi:AFG1/ZapE family ATPase [Oenococcus sp.]|uniref:AFG1/ZapE family ATPase n=1 Tax=Oenococcus sp. TaxID=1979414 RepID=UPI0039ED59FD